MSENPREWSVLLYFAADNDLEGEAFVNLSQLIKIGSTDKVHVLAQIDGRSQVTRRYFMREPGVATAEKVEKKVDGVITNEVNTGSVEDLLDFVRWANVDEHKADHYLVILWGHGSGIDDDEDDLGTAQLKAAKRKKLAAEAADKAAAEELAGLSVGLLAATHVKTMNAVADVIFDGNPGPVSAAAASLVGLIPDRGDALTCFEIKEAFEQIREELHGADGKKVAIFGMDACLMSMAEIARQVSDSVELLVASEEVIPDKSWPYDRILRILTEKTDSPMTPEELAMAIVHEYLDSYKSDPTPVMLSVCKLENARDLIKPLGELGQALEELIKNRELRKAVTKARRKTQSFRFRDYIDLQHFCETLQQTLEEAQKLKPAASAAPHVETVKRACQKVIEAIKGKEGDPRFGEKDDPRFVVYTDHTSGAGGALSNARGVSIYFPPLPPTYADLTLCAESRWNTFLFEYIDAVFCPPALRQQSAGSLPGEPPDAVESFAVAAGAARSNGPDSKTEGGIFFVSNNVTGDRKARLLLPEGTQITQPDGTKETLDAQAFLLLGADAEIKVPAGTEFDIPVKGKVKASTGTETKATSGTRTDALAEVEMEVPASTLSQPFSGGGTKELSDGTKIKSAAGGVQSGRIELDVPSDVAGQRAV